MSIIPSIDFHRMCSATHTHTAPAAVAFNMDRWQIKKTYWLNLSSSAAIHLQARTLLLAFNRKCKRMEIVSEVSRVGPPPPPFFSLPELIERVITHPTPQYQDPHPHLHTWFTPPQYLRREKTDKEVEWERYALEFHPDCNRKRVQMHILIR